jgi:EcsC family protein
MTAEISTSDLADLRRAKQLLENRSLAARIAHAVGVPVERLLGLLPAGVNDIVLAATTKALTRALNISISTLGDRQSDRVNARHKTMAAMTGAVGGAFGLAALPLELPASTILMLRSIASIARSEGESIESTEARLACLQVFSLGGPRPKDDAVESGYFAVRAALATAMTDAAEYLAKHGVAQKGAPALVRLTAQIAARFGIPVSEKILAQSVPVIGALGGAGINLLFMDHFQNLARGHFIVRRLERKYGSDVVERAYRPLQIQTGDRV